MFRNEQTEGGVIVNLQSFKNRHGVFNDTLSYMEAYNVSNGQVRKRNSDMIMEQTWYEDPGAKIGYFYDYYHDSEPLKNYKMHPEKDRKKVPIEIKFIVNAYNSENRDQVGYHIQFKPSFDWERLKSISYYKDVFEKRYMAEWPVGLYVDIADDKGIYRRWLVTEPANQLGWQFPTWYVLPCDHLFQWCYKNKKYQMYGVGRSQNS